MSTIANQSEKDIQARIVQKQRSLNPTTTRDILSTFISCPAYRVRNINIIKNQMLLFGQIIAKIQQNQFDQLLTQMNDDKASTLVEYMHRFMQFVGQEGGMSGNALKFYDKILSRFGRGIVMKACFKQTSIVSLVNNYEIGFN